MPGAESEHIQQNLIFETIEFYGIILLVVLWGISAKLLIEFYGIILLVVLWGISAKLLITNLIFGELYP